MEKLLLTAREAALVLGLGRSKVYELMARGRLRSVKVDGSRRIPREALEEFVRSLASESAA